MPQQKPSLLAMDFESVLVPEIWIEVAKKTGVQELQKTTRDIPDYDALMKNRIQILREHNLSLKDIQYVIATINPLPGAVEFIEWLNPRIPYVILSDTFYEFAYPLLAKLNYPALFCHSLSIDSQNMIINYHLRNGGKKETVGAFKNLGFYVLSVGDSHNDTLMLKEADVGILFNAPRAIASEFSQFPAFYEYNNLQKHISKYL